MKRKAFTLIELLLVVVIIMAVYGLAFNAMERVNDKEFALDLETLPKFLQDFHDKNRVSMICIDECERCFVAVEGEPVQEIEPFVERRNEYYIFDYNLQTRDVMFLPWFDAENLEHDVCFRYDIYPDGSQTEMMVVTEEGVVDYAGPFKEVQHFLSLQDAIDMKTQMIDKVKR